MPAARYRSQNNHLNSIFQNRAVIVLIRDKRNVKYLLVSFTDNATTNASLSFSSVFYFLNGNPCQFHLTSANHKVENWSLSSAPSVSSLSYFLIFLPVSSRYNEPLMKKLRVPFPARVCASRMQGRCTDATICTFLFVLASELERPSSESWTNEFIQLSIGYCV